MISREPGDSRNSRPTTARIVGVDRHVHAQRGHYTKTAVKESHRHAALLAEPLRHDDLVRDRAGEKVANRVEEPEEVIPGKAVAHLAKAEKRQECQARAGDDQFSGAKARNDNRSHPQRQQRRQWKAERYSADRPPMILLKVVVEKVFVVVGQSRGDAECEKAGDGDPPAVKAFDHWFAVKFIANTGGLRCEAVCADQVDRFSVACPSDEAAAAYARADTCSQANADRSALHLVTSAAQFMQFLERCRTRVRRADRVIEFSARMHAQSAATTKAMAMRPWEVILAIGTTQPAIQACLNSKMPCAVVFNNLASIREGGDFVHSWAIRLRRRTTPSLSRFTLHEGRPKG